ncbi:MAG TPA: extracellular solute-binding protein [Streptosporangiaceae bacterium]|jgi:multiple sugar transport system substrate-binding protein
MSVRNHPGDGGVSRRGFLGFSAAAGATVLLGSACGAGGVGGGAGNGTGKIRALFMKQAGYSESDIRKMTAAFQKANPKIQVDVELVAYEALHDKIVAAAPAHTYDVVLIDVIWPAEFGSKRIVTDVTGKVSGGIRNGMLPGALATAEYRDHYYGLPWILDTKYLFYNKAHLRKAGVDAASLDTWDGVRAAAKQIKSKGVVDTPLAWSWKQVEALVCDYTQLLGAYGGAFLTPDGKSAAFQTGGGLDALTFMRGTIDDGLTNKGSITWIEDDVLKTFSQGQASFMLNWTYGYAGANDPKASKVAGDVGVLRTPAGPGGKRPGVNGSMALCVSGGSRNQAAAWTYITYLTGAPVQDQYATSSLPCWHASYDDPEVAKANPKIVPIAKEQLADLIARPQVPRYNEMSQVLQAQLQRCLAQGADPAAVLKSAADQAKRILA